MFIYAVLQHGPRVYKIREVYIGHTPLHIMKGVQNRLALMLGFEYWA